MDIQMRGKKAVLAGASKGIGRAVARALAAEGCDVAICARDQAGIDVLLEELRQTGVKAVGNSVDMSDVEGYRGWVAQACEDLGGCDLFISFGSNGGAQASEESWKGAYELDLMATYRGIDAAMPALERSDSASVVIISTTVAIEPSFGPQPYAAIKAAVTNYAGAMAHALAPKGIRVNTISPGPIMIEDGVWNRIREQRPEFYEKTVAQIPLGRLGSAEEVANAIMFLASPLSGFTTGTNLVIDGGMTRRVQH